MIQAAQYNVAFLLGTNNSQKHFSIQEIGIELSELKTAIFWPV